MPGMMRSRKSGRSCQCHTEWTGSRAAEKRDWRRIEQEQQPREMVGIDCPLRIAEGGAGA